MDLSTPSAVTVEIDELVTEGLDRSAAHRLSGALETELGRLITEQGLPPGLEQSSTPVLEIDDLEVKSGVRPERLGRDLASILYRKLGR